MNRVLDSLRRFQLAQAAAVRRACEALGVSEAGLNALRALADAPHGLTMKELSAAIGISPAVATGLVDKLEEKRWVERRIDRADRRSFTVVPTLDDDPRVLETIRELDEPLRRVANSISERDATTVRLLAEALEQTLEEYRPASAQRELSH